MVSRVRYREAVERVQLGRHLRQWPWTLAGTPPLGIDVAESDIDVICCVDDYDRFAKTLWRAFGNFDRFSLWQWRDSGKPVIARFFAEGWEFELFGSPTPLDRQKAVRHFEVEKRLLALASEDLRRAVLVRKNSGIKTEPAFAEVLGLRGDPYDALLQIGHLSDTELVGLLSHAGFITETNGKALNDEQN